MTGARLTNAIEIRWQTNQEINSAGFYLFRNDPTVSEAYAPLTGLMAGKGSSGGSYLFVDEAITPGISYTYLLVERKQDGSLVEYHELAIVLGLAEPSSPRKHYLPLILR